MRKHSSTMIAGIIFLTGLSLLLYPSISNLWNARHQTQVVAEYTKRMESLEDTEKEKALTKAAQYNEALCQDTGRFTPSQEMTAWYRSLLDADKTGMMGYITIPEIRCKLAIYHSVDDSVLQVGVGHLEGSSLPVGGSSTHCVISGHRGLPSARLFTDIDRLEKGDLFYLHVYGKVLAYEVDKISVVEPEDYGPLEIEEGKDLCTLLTCTPYGINTQRLMVRGHRVVDSLYDESNMTSDAARVDTLVVASCVGVVLLLVGFIVSKIWRLRGREKNNS